MTDTMGIGATADPASYTEFRRRLAATTKADVLELGTLRWSADPTHHAVWLPEDANLTMSDVAAGTDVDVVADAHHLVAVFGKAAFNVVIAISVWEHLARPWIAAEQVAAVLRPGGFAYIETHHTFPVHGYPNDYTRWTDNGLRELFEAAGMVVAEAAYSYPATIIPPREVGRWNPSAPAYLNVGVCALRA
jgi:SAM-dependent methyltransferase